MLTRFRPSMNSTKILRPDIALKYIQYSGRYHGYADIITHKRTFSHYISLKKYSTTLGLYCLYISKFVVIKLMLIWHVQYSMSSYQKIDGTVLICTLSTLIKLELSFVSLINKIS